MQTFAKYDADRKLANTWHDVAEANCCECNETEVEGVKERPDMVDTIFESLLILPQSKVQIPKDDSKKNIRYQSSQRVKRKAPKLKREKLEKFTTPVELNFLNYRRLLHNIILRSKVVPP